MVETEYRSFDILGQPAFSRMEQLNQAIFVISGETLLLCMKELYEHIDKVRNAYHHNSVKSMFAFGSATRDELKPSSDIDFVVEIEKTDPLDYSDCYFNLKFELEKLFNRQIDLLEETAIRNPFLKEEIDRTKVLIYGN